MFTDDSSGPNRLLSLLTTYPELLPDATDDLRNVGERLALRLRTQTARLMGRQCLQCVETATLAYLRPPTQLDPVPRWVDFCYHHGHETKEWLAQHTYLSGNGWSWSGTA